MEAQKMQAFEPSLCIIHNLFFYNYKNGDILRPCSPDEGRRKKGKGKSLWKGDAHPRPSLPEDFPCSRREESERERR